MEKNINEPNRVTPSRNARLSGMYFVTFFSFAAILPFATLYYSAAGFSGAQIGALLGIGPLIGVLATPFWNGVADSRKRHRLILLGGVFFSIALYALIPLLTSFLAVLAVVILIALLSSQLLSLQDSGALHMLSNNRARYGRIRFWGTVGWGSGAFFFGLLLERIGLVWMFWGFSIVMAANLILMRGLQFEDAGEPTPVLTGLRSLLQDRRWMLFLLITFLAAIGMGAHNNYLALLVDGMNAQQLALWSFSLPASAVVGAALFISTVAELPILLFSDKLQYRFPIRTLLSIAMIVIAARSLVYALNADAERVLLVQVLHGLTFALLWIVGVNFAAQNAPRGLGATAQGVFNAVLIGLGFSAGSLMSGALIDLTSVETMFAIVAGIVFTGLLAALALDRRFKIFGNS